MEGKILVVGDDPEFRLNMGRLLDSAGYDECYTAADGAEAALRCEEYPPSVVIVDCRCGPWSGSPVAVGQAGEQPPIPVVLVNAAAGPGTGALQAPFAVLPGTIAARELKSIIESALRFRALQMEVSRLRDERDALCDMNVRTDDEAAAGGPRRAPKADGGNAPAAPSAAKEGTSREQALDALMKSEEKYRELVEDISDVIFSTDNDGVFTYMSPRAEAVSGYRPDEVVGKSFTCFLPPDDIQMVGDYFLNSLGGPTPPLECRFITRDGAIRWIRLTGKTIGSEEKPEGLRGIISDITERKKTEEQLSISLVEKETLLREIHHRVKNNFQVIISLLRLQLKNIHDPALEAQFNEAAGRIRTMGIVHEILYGSDSLAVIDFNTYIKRITGHIYGTLALGNRRVALKISAEHINVGIDQAIPCGLLINEIVTNALKHAFPDSFRGDARIAVGLSGQDGYITLSVSDNGIGIPEKTSEKKSDSLGMSLIPLFVEQIGGVMEIDRSGGTGYTVTFRNRCGEYESRLKGAGP